MIDQTLTRVLHDDRGRLLAALVSRTGDFQRAEDALQEAAASALVHWGRAGVPASPAGWLLRAALRKAIDGYRRDASLSRHRDAIAVLAEEEASDLDPQAIPDDRLRLIFTCCHPALSPEARVALTLREVCGLTTEEIARAFLTTPSTLAQRIVRAKSKISEARIPYEERVFTMTTVYGADEMFLTGTGAEVVPVIRVDDRTIGDGKPGPVTRQLIGAFRELVNSQGVEIGNAEPALR